MRESSACSATFTTTCDDFILLSCVGRCLWEWAPAFSFSAMVVAVREPKRVSGGVCFLCGCPCFEITVFGYICSYTGSV